MKITTWNVNGLRAILGKGFKTWIASAAPDVLCLQEIKTRPDQLTAEQRAFFDYNVAWNPAERPGYSGVATLSRKVPAEIRLGMDAPRFDHEGRLICTRHLDFVLYNVYFPSGQRGHDRVAYKLDFYAHLFDVCQRFVAAGENIILTGDFNTAPQPIDLRNARQNQKTSGFLPEERAWVQKYLDHGFVDIFRYLYPEKIQYTWWTYVGHARQRNVGWRLDYFLVSKSLVARVKDLIIHDEIPGSDHCPVSMWIDE